MVMKLILALVMHIAMAKSALYANPEFTMKDLSSEGTNLYAYVYYYTDPTYGRLMRVYRNYGGTVRYSSIGVGVCCFIIVVVICLACACNAGGPVVVHDSGPGVVHVGGPPVVVDTGFGYGYGGPDVVVDVGGGYGGDFGGGYTEVAEVGGGGDY